ncbi:hypothetical protein HYDPIDRAFT_188981 [Hydnomerulius pinastri MD-312]|uniref:Uncharacterized protein n=1 Tax=Hydnomerulius pinastri MD-312 TaxID=994086 RepID=A0A0C9VWZ4_9AGAM|nr:hypothetical protein HYDPIDRAFT_188981 [Hydnomerulius pinastri MD-312]
MQPVAVWNATSLYGLDEHDRGVEFESSAMRATTALQWVRGHWSLTRSVRLWEGSAIARRGDKGWLKVGKGGTGETGDGLELRRGGYEVQCHRPRASPLEGSVPDTAAAEVMSTRGDERRLDDAREILRIGSMKGESRAEHAAGDSVAQSQVELHRKACALPLRYASAKYDIMVIFNKPLGLRRALGPIVKARWTPITAPRN